jgi:hypothetical protein
MKVLLVEPAYKNKYPPLGLMKIATFHRDRGDRVRFIKGLNNEIREQAWDRIYITTLFSFYWAETIKTVKYYEYSVKDPQNLFIGGPMATIMAKEIQEETGFEPVVGLLNKKGKIKLPYDCKIDNLVPDYCILQEIDYKYPANDAYLSYMTRGCIRHCEFCAVPTLEPKYVEYIPLLKQIQQVDKKYGKMTDLLLLDNNVLASDRFDDIVDEIKRAGFYKGAKLNNKERHVDFNQGVDMRKLTKEKMRRLSELPVRPLRIAFDHIGLKDKYIEKIEWAAEFGMLNLSNYILYNFHDKPEDFYERLRINIMLNERLGTKIFSFPMKYIPIKNKDRKYVGEHWNARYLRGIQCILHATHGVVSPRRAFFEAAFGKNVDEFKKLILMPDNYIIYRDKHRCNGTVAWKKQVAALSPKQKEEFIKIVHENHFNSSVQSKHEKVNALLKHYKKKKAKSSQLDLL